MKQRSFAGAVSTLATQLVKFVLQFGSTVVLARFLHPAEFGIVAMVTPILAFAAAVTDLGFGQAIMQRRDLQPGQLSSLFWINGAVGAAIAAALILSSPLVVLIYGEAEVQPVLCSLAGIVVLNSLSMAPIALLLRQMRFVAQTAIELLGVLARVGFTVWAAWSGFSYWSLVIGQLAGAVTTLVVAFLVSGWRPAWPRIVEGTREIARFGVNLTGVNLANFLSLVADNIIVGSFAGKVALGLFDRSHMLLLQPLMQLLAPLGRVALPLLSRVYDDETLYRRTYVRLLMLCFWLSTPMVVFALVLADPLILFIWGERWSAAIPIFRWFGLWGLASPVFLTTAWLYASEGRTGLQLKLALVAAAISVTSFLVGVRWGAVGVVLANGLTYVFLQTPIMVWGATRGGVVRGRDFVDAIVPAFIAAVAAGGVLALGRPVVHGWWTVAALMASYVVFTAAFMIFRSGRELAAFCWGLVRSARDRQGLRV